MSWVSKFVSRTPRHTNGSQGVSVSSSSGERDFGLTSESEPRVTPVRQVPPTARLGT